MNPPLDLETSIPETFNMTTALLDRHVELGNSERLAIVTNSESLTYAQLLALVNRAANGLLSPSSAARALYGGAPNIERVDRLVQAVAAQKGMRNEAIDEVVKLVDAQLEKNRKARKAA